MSPDYITLDKREYQVNIFLYLHKNIGCGYSLEAPHRGASNEYPQPMFFVVVFLRRSKKNINLFWLKKTPYLELCNFGVTLFAIHPTILNTSTAVKWSCSNFRTSMARSKDF